MENSRLWHCQECFEHKTVKYSECLESKTVRGVKVFAPTSRMDFLSVTKHLTQSVIYDLEAYVKTFKKEYYFGLAAMVTTQGLLLAKHGNKRNYKTKHCMFTILR